MRYHTYEHNLLLSDLPQDPAIMACYSMLSPMRGIGLWSHGCQKRKYYIKEINPQPYETLGVTLGELFSPA